MIRGRINERKNEKEREFESINKMERKGGREWMVEMERKNKKKRINKRESENVNECERMKD